MSTLHKTQNINFEGRKPSKAQVMRAIGKLLESGEGYKSISVYWGENWIDLDFYENAQAWLGNGWIKEIGGDDIAKELNAIRKQALYDIKRRAAQEFVDNHFTFVHIG